MTDETQSPDVAVGDWWQKRSLRICVVTWLTLSILSLFLARRNGTEPGLYYDEAVFAGTAKEFVAKQERGPHMPGMTMMQINGASIPLLIQPYLGGLKCWILACTFSLFGPTTAVVRFTALGCNLFSLLLLMLWINRWIGVRHAVLTAALLATDPSYFFSGVLDWGVASPSYVSRCCCFYFANLWWTTDRGRYLHLAAICAGIGFFNKIDFLILIAGSLISAAVCNHKHLIARVMRQPQLFVVSATLFCLAAGPILWNVMQFAFLILAGKSVGVSSDFADKLATTLAMYDGSYFFRLMESGGDFRAMHRLPPSVWTPFGVLLCAAFVGLGISLVAVRVAPPLQRSVGFVMLALAIITIGVLLLPRSVRLHHTVLSYPFPHVLLSMAFLMLWDCRFRSVTAIRVVKSGCVVGIVLMLASQLGAISQIQNIIYESGGRGLWSNSFDAFCQECNDHPELTIVSLDWGFNEQLTFLTNRPRLVEPIWNYHLGQVPSLQPNHNVIYVLRPAELSVVPGYFHAARAQSEFFEIREYRDRQGGIAFCTIRFRERKAFGSAK